ncbi:MAG: hypothetical protein QOD99_3203 [Chthoniobacter sp.]|nr:hypothetical protein [Chthoniobacter sp.]
MIDSFPDLVALGIAPATRMWFVLGGAVLCYALLMWTNPVRTSLRDGLRCVRRYPKIWGILTLFSFCYAFFQVALRVFYYFVLPEAERPDLTWAFTWALPKMSARLGEAHTLGDWWSAIHAAPSFLLIQESALTAAEAVAGVFNNVITTFPFSAAAAALLLTNWERHHTTLRRALLKRFGAFGWFLHLALLLCAIAAILKPVLFGPSLPVLNRVAPGLLLLQWSALIDWLSFLFEYLFGVCIQIYLMLMVYAWVRGLTFTPQHLLDVAIRRFSFVVKWAVLVMIVGALLIDLPRIRALTFHFDEIDRVMRTFGYIDTVARPLLALFLMLFATIQITLTLHSESLPKAMRDHLRFLRRHGWQLTWFLLIAGLHFFVVSCLNNTLLAGFGVDSAAALAWSLFFPLLGAFVAAWMLASWVCLFKRCETSHAPAQVQFKF